MGKVDGKHLMEGRSLTDSLPLNGRQSLRFMVGNPYDLKYYSGSIGFLVAVH
ncbi:MAG: hypothetical protein ACR5K7_02780 [Symbiopectobacterium sp.]